MLPKPPYTAPPTPCSPPPGQPSSLHLCPTPRPATAQPREPSPPPHSHSKTVLAFAAPAHPPLNAPSPSALPTQSPPRYTATRDARAFPALGRPQPTRKSP